MADGLGRQPQGCAPPIRRYRGLVVHLSVAIGRFFEALLYALFGIAFWTTLEVLAGAAALIGLIALARRLLKGDKRQR